MSIEFRRFVHFGDGTVAAEFRRSAIDNESVRFNEESLALRAENLRRGGFDASVEEEVLALMRAGKTA